jgi:hypothetical protein
LMPQTKFFIFHFSLVVWPILFKFQNENFHFKFQTWKFKNFHFHVVVQKNWFQISKMIFSNFLWWHRRKLFDPRLPNLFKIYKSYLFTLKKIACIPPCGSMTHCKRVKVSI